MREPLPTLLKQLERMHSRGIPFALVTLIGVEGMSPRKLGARMWVAQDGFTLGTVSFGSCGDGVIREQALGALETNLARRFTFALGEDEDSELGLVCTGHLEVFLEPNPQVKAVWQSTLERLSLRQTVNLYTTLEPQPQHVSQDIPQDVPQDIFVEPTGVPVFLERWLPPPHLVIIGAGNIAQPLVRLAREVGCLTTIFDSRPEKVSLEAFPQADFRLSGDLERVLLLEQSDPFTAVVVVSHNYADEIFALKAALSSFAGYIAVLASHKRGRAILRFLEELEFSKASLERIHTPAGLDLGLDTPAGIALSILAEMTAVLHGKTAVPFISK